MNVKEISHLRLQNQKILSSSFKNPEEVVRFFGAMQAQDLGMAKWAVGIRLKRATEQKIQTSMDKGKIIRTHLLRPTWHLVSAQDVYWMNGVGAANIKRAMAFRDKELELSERIFTKSLNILEKSLSENGHLTREEISLVLEKNKISAGSNRTPHILLRAELEGIVCSGIRKGKHETYALLDERVPEKNNLQRDEALAKLASLYFNSRGPATLQDFTWWSGLSIREARSGLDAVVMDFESFKSVDQTYYLPKNKPLNAIEKSKGFLLPAFDEFIISYKDRSASLLDKHRGKAISTNGLFRPVIIVKSLVAGIWKRDPGKDKVTIETDYFTKPNISTQRLIQKAALQFGKYLGMKSAIVIKNKPVENS